MFPPTFRSISRRPAAKHIRIQLGSYAREHVHLGAITGPQRVDGSTSGMSAHRMNVPPHFDEYARAELVMTLPHHWPSIEDIYNMGSAKSATYLCPVEELLAPDPHPISQ